MRRNEGENRNKKRIALLALLGGLTLAPHVQAEEARNAALDEMAQAGEVQGDCEKVFSKSMRKLSFESAQEVAFAAVYTDQGNCRIVPLANGSEAEVRLDMKLVQELERSNANKVVYYHTHPAAGDPANAYRIAPPSNDDFMTMVDKEVRKQDAAVGVSTEERVVTPLGIWHYGVSPNADLKEKSGESLKLGSLFSYQMGDTLSPERAATLDELKPGYADVARSYYTLEHTDELPLSGVPTVDNAKALEEIAERTKIAEQFSNAMNHIGYNVHFAPFDLSYEETIVASH